MSNPLADNAQPLQRLGKKRFLRATKEGVPFDKQVPRTIQVYSGTGGTVDYDGSNDLVINTLALTGTLFVRFGPAARNIRNLLNRQLHIHILGTTTRDIIIVSSPAAMTIAGTFSSTNNYTVRGDSTYKMLTITFVTPNLLSLDGGAWGSTQIAGIMPRVAAFSTRYAYGQSSPIAAVIAQIYDNASYNITYSEPEPIDEGEVTAIITTGNGIGNIFGAFIWSPASRVTKPISVYVNMIRPSGEFANFTVITLVPDLSNVFGLIEYITGPLSGSKNIGMYDTVSDPGGQLVMCQQSGNVVELPEEPLALALNIQDNVFFYNTPTSPNVINWFSLSTTKTGILCDMDNVGTANWSSGATVADIDYCETNSVIYVLPASASQRLAMIPTKRYDYLQNSELRTGPVRSINGTGAPSTVQMSIAVDTETLGVYIANQPTFSNILISEYATTNNLALLQSLNTGYNSGTMSLTFSTRGDLIAQSSTDNLLLRVQQGLGIAGGIVSVSGTYPLPVTFASMSRNLYGCFPK